MYSNIKQQLLKKYQSQKKEMKKAKVKEVEIKVALAYYSDVVIKNRRGKTQIIRNKASATKEDILEKAFEKHARLDQTFDDSVSYKLLYPHFSEIEYVPGTKDLFKLREYKVAVGKDCKHLIIKTMSVHYNV